VKSKGMENKTLRSKKKQKELEQVVAKVVKKTVTSELKYFEQYAAGPISIAGNIVNISDITQGTDVTQRIGQQVKFSHCELKFHLTIAGAATPEINRVMLVMDMQGYNAPVIGDIVEPLFAATAWMPIATLNWNYKRRFQVLFDRAFAMNNAATPNVVCEKRVRLGGKVANYIGASTTFKNQIYLLFMTSESNVLALPNYYFTFRLYFHDD